MSVSGARNRSPRSVSRGLAVSRIVVSSATTHKTFCCCCCRAVIDPLCACSTGVPAKSRRKGVCCCRAGCGAETAADSTLLATDGCAHSGTDKSREGLCACLGTGSQSKRMRETSSALVWSGGCTIIEVQEEELSCCVMFLSSSSSPSSSASLVVVIVVTINGFYCLTLDWARRDVSCRRLLR